MEFKKVDFGRQGNLILALLLIHFVFFGYLSNLYRKTIGINILFLHNVLFSPISYLSSIILFIIIFLMTFRENFFEYGIRNSIWTIPFIVIESWVWFWFIDERFDITIISYYFAQWQSYVTMLSLFMIILLASLLGAMAKEKYKRYIIKAQALPTE
ncbi:MAG: hypothetical protein ACFFCV_18195 [Promethearchaeota archaeon]